MYKSEQRMEWLWSAKVVRCFGYESFAGQGGQ